VDLSFVQTPMVSAILAAITVISLLFAIYSHRRNASNQKLGYRIQGKPLFRKSKFSEFLDPDLKLRGVKIDSLYAMRIQIVNNGTIAVEPKDLAPNGTITVKCVGSQLREIGKHCISAGIAETDNPRGRFEIETSTPEGESLPEIVLKFDYIPPRSGVVIDAITTVPPENFIIDDTTKSFGPIRNLNNISIGKLFEMLLFISSTVGSVILVFHISTNISDDLTRRMGFVTYDGFGMPISIAIGSSSMFLLGALIYLIVTKVPRYIIKKSTYYWLSKGLVP
jgi:hypothetical protein